MYNAHIGPRILGQTKELNKPPLYLYNEGNGRSGFNQMRIFVACIMTT